MQLGQEWQVSCVWIFCGYTYGDDMTLWPRFALKLVQVGFGHFKVYLRQLVWSNTGQLANVEDAVERQTHRNL